jgi:hypothetical protein
VKISTDPNLKSETAPNTDSYGNPNPSPTSVDMGSISATRMGIRQRWSGVPCPCVARGRGMIEMGDRTQRRNKWCFDSACDTHHIDYFYGFTL